MKNAQYRHDSELITSSGGIAVANLNAQVDGLTARLHRARSEQQRTTPLVEPAAAPLVDLLLLRGQVLGRIADYERAADLADALVRDAPEDGTARLARVRTRAVLHCFPSALADLDAAKRRGAAPAALDAERAAILQAIGCFADALALRRHAAERQPGLMTIGSLAVLHAERGDVREAERCFAEARARYRGVSPFPVAELDFRHGLMWLRQRDLAAARLWFDAAVRRVPAYAPAQGHLAEVDAALGVPKAAVARLRPLVMTSDDPEYAGTLAGLLRDAGRPLEAERWRGFAAARYDELVARHPEAFTDHAAHFWLSVGGDLQRWLPLAQHHRVNRRAARELADEHGLDRAS